MPRLRESGGQFGGKTIGSLEQGVKHDDCEDKECCNPRVRGAVLPGVQIQVRIRRDRPFHLSTTLGPFYTPATDDLTIELTVRVSHYLSDLAHDIRNQRSF